MNGLTRFKEGKNIGDFPLAYATTIYLTKTMYKVYLIIPFHSSNLAYSV